MLRCVEPRQPAAYNFRSTPPTAASIVYRHQPFLAGTGVITARTNTYPLLSFLYLPAHVSIYLSANHFIGRSITAGSCDAAAAANYVIGKVTAACAACNSAATAKSHAPVPRQFFLSPGKILGRRCAKLLHRAWNISLTHVSSVDKSLTKLNKKRSNLDTSFRMMDLHKRLFRKDKFKFYYIVRLGKI